MSGYHDLASAPAWNAGLLGLMYHAIEAPPLFHPLRGLYVDPALLERQLHELANAGLSLSGLSAWIDHPDHPTRQVAVTFDDAFQDLRENALPVLGEMKACATTYVVAGQIGGTNVWDSEKGAQMRPLMDRRDLLAWQAAGHEIGSHGVSHCHLTRVSLAQARSEIFDSKKMLEDLAGRPVRHFCYPYGDHNEAICDLVGEAGYATATTVEQGLNDAAADPLRLRRYPVAHRRPYRAALRGALLRSVGMGSRRTAWAAVS